jgi:hypothetical protein
MSSAIDNLLDFSTPFDEQKLQTLDQVVEGLYSNQPATVSTTTHSLLQTL